ncbi:hypothetical protein PMI10_03088 [Flavobacterium sp. CF136]|nr:hypothetical protein PMI10_03088 [Flavobacterium sp. CF136]
MLKKKYNNSAFYGNNSNTCFFVFYYSFFIKLITKEEAGINEYASLLSIENNTKSKIYLILNFNFSNIETQKFKKYT